MKKFRVLVQFEMLTEVDVEAEDINQALDAVYDLPIPTLMEKAEFIVGSRLPWDNAVVEILVDKSMNT